MAQEKGLHACRRCQGRNITIRQEGGGYVVACRPCLNAVYSQGKRREAIAEWNAANPPSSTAGK